MTSLKNDIYEGFSLVEMIITIFILGMVMVISATTLTTLVKVSTISQAKDATRNDVDFALEIANRSLSNANLTDIRVFNSHGTRTYNSMTNTFVDSDTDPDLANTYTQVADDTSATEVQVRSYGYKRWTCIGWFQGTGADSNKGYILKTSSENDIENHPENCFKSGNPYTIVLNSREEVTINDFSIVRTSITGEENTFFTIDITAEPLVWPVSAGVPVEKDVTKQITVSTRGLTWYY